MREFIGNHSEKDREVVKKQLDTEDLVMGGVLKRCVYGYPEIILLLPVEQCDPHHHGTEKSRDLYRSFSNFLWLTCPYLNKKIHELESQGLVNKISDYIQDDNKMRYLMNKAHASYYFYRKRICQQYADMCGHPEDAVCMNNTGIGGIHNTDFLKCLHHHYGHYHLCSSNVAGKITDEMVSDDRYCKDEMCQYYA